MAVSPKSFSVHMHTKGRRSLSVAKRTLEAIELRTQRRSALSRTVMRSLAMLSNAPRTAMRRCTAALRQASISRLRAGHVFGHGWPLRLCKGHFLRFVDVCARRSIRVVGCVGLKVRFPGADTRALTDTIP